MYKIYKPYEPSELIRPIAKLMVYLFVKKRVCKKEKERKGKKLTLIMLGIFSIFVGFLFLILSIEFKKDRLLFIMFSIIYTFVGFFGSRFRNKI